jgi:hypothetical protein
MCWKEERNGSNGQAHATNEEIQRGKDFIRNPSGDEEEMPDVAAAPFSGQDQLTSWEEFISHLPFKAQKSS